MNRALQKILCRHVGCFAILEIILLIIWDKIGLFNPNRSLGTLRQAFPQIMANLSTNKDKFSHN